MGLSLKEKIAQLFIIGFEGPKPGAVLEQFLSLGPGGVIFFRDNFQPMKHPANVRAMLDDISGQVPRHLPRPFLSIDQEGGQVERLPHTIFPSLITPRAIAVSNHPEALAQETYSLLSASLANLGFNLNYFPTLDVNLNNQNPVIGVRSFGDDPNTVSRLSEIAMRCHHDAGLITVGKHFPGHGNGRVDSHDRLPVLRFSEAELSTFRQAVVNGLPCMMIAHGLYPGLQPDEEIKRNLPASASPFVMQTLLRERLQFTGIIMTDDLCMGAVLGVPPEEAALRALEAGADMLIYRQSTPTEWRVLEAVVEAVNNGRLSEARIDDALARIHAVKQTLTPQPYRKPGDFQAQADAIAEKSITLLAGSLSRLARHHLEDDMLLVHPDRSAITNYRFDQPTSPELPDCFHARGILPASEICYRRGEETAVPDEFMPASVIVFVAFNAIRDTAQQHLYERLRRQYPDAPVAVVSAGTPDDMAVLPGADAYIAACGYRPSTMRALASFFARH